MNIQQFQYVLAVVDLKNFEAAAEKCSVTQSTLSTMIGKFEAEIGIKIFNRKTKPVSITAEGEQIISKLKVVLNEIDSLRNVIQELKGEMVGELRIGIIPTMAPYLLPLFLTDFASLFPKVKMIVREMTTSQIQQELKIRSLDIGVLALPIGDPELEEIELFSEPFLIYDCTEDPCDSKVDISRLDYSKLCLLQEGHCLRTQVQRICELSDQLAKTDVNFEFESGSMDSLLRITRTRKGITVIPYLASFDLTDGEDGELLEFESPVPVRKVGLITHKYFVKKRLLKGFQEVIKKVTADLIPVVDKETVLTPR